MKEIKLSQEGTNKGRYVAKVDDEDYQFLMEWNWYALITDRANTIYAARVEYINGKQKQHLMHRVIMEPPMGYKIDHKDHNGLNNQKSNLRICTTAENNRNRKLRIDNKTGYKGVSINTRRRGDKIYSRIRADIRINNKTTFLGHFDTIIAAAKAYDHAAKKHFGEFANLNFKP